MLALLVLATTTLPTWAQYVWKDSSGQAHASDMPPPRDIPDKDVLQRPKSQRAAVAGAKPALDASSTASAPASAPNKPPVDPELEARRKRAQLETQARAQADADRLAAQRADNCQRARQQLATLDNGQRQFRFNERGEREVVDDATRNNEAQLARQAISADCR